MLGFVRVCAGVQGDGRVSACLSGYARLCACVWDEFSEFLPENGIPTSADLNTYFLQIF